MPKKIRVYELAHELGLTNKEALDLCLSLGMGVKSHSSSIEDAQADRARRKADREGLRRPVQPEEPAAPAKKAAAKKAPAKKAAPASESATPATPASGTEDTTDGGDAGPTAPPVKRTGARLVTSRPASEQPGVAPAPAPAPRPAAPAPAATPAPAPVAPVVTPAPAPAPRGPGRRRPAAPRSEAPGPVGPGQRAGHAIRARGPGGIGARTDPEPGGARCHAGRRPCRSRRRCRRRCSRRSSGATRFGTGPSPDEPDRQADPPAARRPTPLALGQADPAASGGRWSAPRSRRTASRLHRPSERPRRFRSSRRPPYRWPPRGLGRRLRRSSRWLDRRLRGRTPRRRTRWWPRRTRWWPRRSWRSRRRPWPSEPAPAASSPSEPRGAGADHPDGVRAFHGAGARERGHHRARLDRP